MTISVANTVSDGVDRMASKAGAAMLGAFFLLQVVNDVVLDSFLGSLIEFALAQTEYGMGDLRDRLLDQGYPELWTQVDAAYQDAVSSGIDMPFAVAVGLLLLLPLVGELVYVVGVRAIAVADSDPVPTDRITEGLGLTVLESFVAGVIALILIFLGLVFLVIPGLVLAVLFLFVRQHVVLSDDGVFAAISESVSTVRANLLPAVALAAILFVLGVMSFFLTGAIPVDAVQWVVQSVFAVLAISLVTSAFLQHESAVPV